MSVRLARDAEDLAAVQRLRWQVFFAEMGANGTSFDPTERFDRDAYDEVCDHLLVIDEDRDWPESVVGTYRLLRESVAERHGGFYSAGEFDLTRLIHREKEEGDTRELLELGRSCVLPAYRTSATISMLWRGIGEYIAANRIAMMFGCASFTGTDPDLYAPALSYLYHQHLAPEERRPVVHPGKGVAMERLARGSYDERRAMLQLPPLVKGYMRVGAKFGNGVYIDHDFNTVDVCVLMPVDLIADRYLTRFSAAA
ncbi:MAG TPA: GNAT family N-acyltransferase [Novosphingobium sp.]|nr:GNAT family N-acyltransferase [Novosphingobium sp.]